MLTKENLTAIHTSLELEEEQGNVIARIAKTEKLQEDDTNTYVRINYMDFHNGIIEVDVCGKLLPDAPPHARGFIGIVFRVNENNSEFESFYIRPTNGRDCTDSVRKEHACQYFSYPGYTFSYFREHNITDFETSLDNIALGEWAHLKAVIRDEKAEFYVNEHLAFLVPHLKHGGSFRGSVGLYVDIGTDGYFKNLSIFKEVS